MQKKSTAASLHFLILRWSFLADHKLFRYNCEKNRNYFVFYFYLLQNTLSRNYLMGNIFKTEKLNAQICSAQLLEAVENLETTQKAQHWGSG